MQRCRYCEIEMDERVEGKAKAAQSIASLGYTDLWFTCPVRVTDPHNINQPISHEPEEALVTMARKRHEAMQALRNHD